MVKPSTKTRRIAKFNNKKTKYLGITFDSYAEACRYGVLREMEREGLIANLELQPRYPFVHNGVTLWDYVADFAYWERDPGSGVPVKFVVEDVKSPATAKDSTFILKRKAFEASQGVPLSLVMEKEASSRKLVERTTIEQGVAIIAAE